MIKPIKKVIVASIGAIVSISSLSAFADNSDSKDNKDSDGTSSLCFHIDETPHHPDPAGSYVAIRMKNTSALKLDGKPLKLKEARGIAIGRAPILVGTPSWGDWVGNPMTGTCHKHDDEIQCGFQSISAITTPF